MRKFGLRMIKEDDELRQALNNIYPGMTEAYIETINRNFLGLNRLFEGQVDLDRADFIVRDSFFAGENFSKNSRIVSELFDNVSLEKLTDESGKSRIVPVFANNQLRNLERFFTNRFNAYKNLYYCTDGFTRDYVMKAFSKRLINSAEEYTLKDFLTHNIDKKVDEVDLQEYVGFNDIEFLKGIMEVADKTQDSVLRKLALMSLPSRDKFTYFYYGAMVSIEQVDEKGNRKRNSKSDEDFIARFMQQSDEVKKIYEDNCIPLRSSKKEDVETVVEQIKGILKLKDDDLEKQGIISWKNHIASYKDKNGEETYVRAKDGNIYEYSQLPDRKEPILETDVHGFCLLIPLLEEKGYSNEEIMKVKSYIEEYNRRLENNVEHEI